MRNQDLEKSILKYLSILSIYIVGLRYDIVRIIFFQPYHSLQYVMKLALKVRAKKSREILLQLRVWLKKGLPRI